MKATAKLETLVTLVLNTAEARWLKGVMQNPMHEDESEEDSKMRELFFNAINNATNCTLHVERP